MRFQQFRLTQILMLMAPVSSPPRRASPGREARSSPVRDDPAGCHHRQDQQVTSTLPAEGK
jgi:hypothetical protein